MSNEYKDWNADIKEEQEYNKQLCTKYPFLIPRNRWTDKIVEDYDFSYTELDNVEDGWRTLALNLCKEIKQELLKYEGALEGYRIVQIKEKYGFLHWYDNGAPTGSKIYEIISKYEEMSKRICGKCGARATRVTTNWYYPFCDRCVPVFKKQKVPTVDIEEFYKEMGEEDGGFSG